MTVHYLDMLILCVKRQAASLPVSSCRKFCNISDYIDGMAVYKYKAILCNFEGFPPVHACNGNLPPITPTPPPPPGPINLIWNVARRFGGRSVQRNLTLCDLI